MGGTFSNWGALKRALQDEMRDALQETADKSAMDILKHNEEYYGGGTPKKYIRTGAFGNAMDEGEIQGGGDSLSVTVMRDGAYTYGTGSFPSGWTVFNWAESGSAGLVGLTGTWAATESDIELNIDTIFGSHFN